jgi:hypothetical protein
MISTEGKGGYNTGWINNNTQEVCAKKAPEHQLMRI